MLTSLPPNINISTGTPNLTHAAAVLFFVDSPVLSLVTGGQGEKVQNSKRAKKINSSNSVTKKATTILSVFLESLGFNYI